MTDDRDTKDLETRLEQATSRDCPGEGSLDPETAALRAGWLALGELLETAQPQDESPLPQLPPPPAPQRSRRWLPAMIAALAASVLIVAAVAWSMRATTPTGVPAPALSEIADSRGKPAPAVVKPAPAVTLRQKPAASGDVEAWDDSLDQEIEMAGRAIRHVRQDQLASAADAGRVEYQLETLKKDIEDNTL